VIVRRFARGDEAIVEALAEAEPQTALLDDPRTIFLAALDDDGRPIGFVFGYELPRRHGDPTMLFVYEVGVSAAYRRRGVATRLLRELAAVARGRGIAAGFVLTSASNTAAMALYESVGGTRPGCDDVLWDFEWSAVR
jgi:aminoglycoside 3-N-acetyltransferase I